MRLLAYIRVSTDDQAEHGHSLDVQRRRLEAYCEAHEIELAGVHVDAGVSATVPLAKRPQGRALLLALQTRQADGVVVVALDRLWRDVFDGVSTLRSLEHLDVAIHSLREHIATDTPAGRLNMHILLATGQYERELIADRARATTCSLQEQGRVYGPVPFGCIKVDGLLFREPRRWDLRQWIMRAHESGDSLRTLRDRLLAARIPSPTGSKRWPLGTLSNLIESHDRLSLLPLCDAAHDAAVSEAA